MKNLFDLTSIKPPLEILLCAPRGFCAGVDRAIQIVELALERFEERSKRRISSI